MKAFSDFKSIDEQINEVLSKDASAGEWISDFVKSDNPKFAGKSAAKRKEMALAAYYAKQRNEATLQPNGTDKVEPDAGMCSVCGAKNCEEHKDYISPAVTGYVKESTPYYNKPSFLKKMGRVAKQERLAREKKEAEQKSIKEESDQHEYSLSHHEVTKKNADAVKAVIAKHGAKHTGTSDKGTWFNVHKDKSDAFKRDLKSHGVYADRMDEEVVNEISKETLGNYVHKSFARGNEIHKQLDKQVDDVQSPEERAKLKAELSKRNSGVIKAAQKMRNEELELNETTRHTVRVQVSDPRDETGFKTRKAVSVLAASPKHAEKAAHKHFTDKGYKVHSVEVKKPVSEDVDMGQADRTLRSKDKSGSTYNVKDSSGKIISTHDNHSDAMRAALKHDDHKVVKESKDTVEKDASGKVKSWSHEGDWEKMSTKKQGSGKAANLAGQALQKTKELNKEEVDLDEDAVSDYRDRKRAERHAEHEKQDPKMAKIYAKNMVDTTKASKKAEARGIKKNANDFGWQVRNGVQRGKLPEEVELEESWEVYDTKTRVVHSKHDTQRKAYNAMNKLNDKHPGYETPGNLIASKFGARASKEVKEEVQIDEVTLQAHKVGVTVSNPNHPSVSQRKETIQKHVIVKATDKGDAQAKAESFYKKKGFKVHDSFHHSVVPATSLKTEETQIDEAAWGKDKATNLRQAHDRHMEKALAANKAGDDEAVKTHQRKMQMIQGKLQKLKQNEDVELGEECEILSELSKGTLGSYVKKASEQGKKAAVSAQQSGQGLTTAIASGNEHLASVHDDNIKYSKNLEKKRAAGVSKAVDKLTKEDTMLTYSEFMAQLAESRADDLKDKLAADREARLNNYDYSKEKAAKKNPVTKVKGHSYGAGDEDGEAEPAKAAEPAEKRGRGRPAGSKSGARA